MSDYLPQDYYVLKIGKAYVYPYGDQHQYLKDALDTSVMAGKERIEKLQKRFGGTIFQVYIKELEPEKPKEEESIKKSCYNCKHGAFGFDSDLGCNLWQRGKIGTTCQFWKGETDGD